MPRVFTAAFTVLVLTATGVFAAEGLGAVREPAKVRFPFFNTRPAGVRCDPRLVRATEIALQRAHRQTTWYCWRYVKNALLEAGAVRSRPTTPYAKDAGWELVAKHGFTRLPVRDPYKAPVGAVLVYGGADAGHVELRAPHGFVSDFYSQTPYRRPLLGVYIKPS